MTERSDASHTRRFVAYFVERAHTKLTLQTQRVLGAYVGLTPRQWWIIADMATEKPRTATELSRIGDVDKGLLSRNLKTLEEMGLVSTRRSALDRREVEISLTEAGYAKYRETVPYMEARNAHVTAAMSDEDFETLQRLLAQVTEAAERTNFDLD